MLALIAPIKDRLAALPTLVDWAVRSSTGGGDRSRYPAAVVRMGSAQLTDSTSSDVVISPTLAVQLIVPRSDDAADQLDAAFLAVIGSLHDWAPGRVGVASRNWTRLALVGVAEPQFEDAGLAGIELFFNTSASFSGHS